jgi:soluble lytic murein transglycosylase-like protein
LDAEVARLKPYYTNTISYFNSRLSAPQRDLIAEAILRFSMSNGLDPRLTMSVIAVESSFRPEARSNHGAMGLGQLMPGTAAGMGVTNAYDPVQNVQAAVKLIRGHLNNYKKRPDAFSVALAAYNAGSGAVRRHGGVPPYRETVNHIWKVHRLYKQLAPDMFH